MKIILFIIVIFVILLIVTEISAFSFIFNKYRVEFLPFEKKGILKHYVVMKNLKQEDLTSVLRQVEYRNPNKRPLVIFGGSHAWGHDLPVDETFSRKLADRTNRTVVNRAKCSEGPAFMYYQLANKDITEKIKSLFTPPPHGNITQDTDNTINKDAEYVIYVNISGHNIRNLKYRNHINEPFFSVRYKLKNNELIEDKVSFPKLHSLYMFALIEKCIDNINLKNNDYINEVYEKLILESAELACKEFPNSKFAVVIMPDGKADIRDDIERPQLRMWERIQEELGQEKITIIDVQKELSLEDSEKYWLPDNSHPTAQAWDEIVPIIIRKLNL